MSRYLLDTNILIFLTHGELDNLSLEIKDILNDYHNQLYTSSINIVELLQLFTIDKI